MIDKPDIYYNTKSMNEKGLSPLIAILLIFSALALITGGFLLGRKDPDAKSTTSLAPEQYQTEKANPGYEGQLYKNEKMNYSINLPKNWRKLEKSSYKDKYGQADVFSPYTDEQIDEIIKKDPYNPNYYLTIELRDNPKDASLYDWVTKSEFSPQSAAQKEEEATIDGIPAFKVLGNQGPGYTDYYFFLHESVYNLSYYYNPTDALWASPKEFTKKTFEDIIATFKILDKSK